MSAQTHPRYHFAKTTAADRLRGTCRARHALSAATIVKVSRYQLCAGCLANYDREAAARPARMAVERLCRTGEHVIPAGVKRCGECARANKRVAETNPGTGPFYMRVPMPDVEILDAAACGLETAMLFDPAPYGAFSSKAISQAIAICVESCPVLEACRAYGMAHGATGVYGGVYLVRGVPAQRGRSLNQGTPLVHTVQSVQDSTAC